MVSDETIRSQAEEVARTLDLNLDFYAELSNETWNGAFSQFSYFWQVAQALALPSKRAGRIQQNLSASGLRTLQVMKVVSATWQRAGRQMTNLKRVMSCQATGDRDLFQMCKFNGADLDFQYNSAPNRPIDNCDVVSYANYWTGAQLNSKYASGGPAFEYSGLTAAADDYASGNPSRMTAALRWVDNDLKNGGAAPTGNPNFTLASLASAANGGRGIFPGWEAVVASYDSPRARFIPPLAPLTVEAYEGGQSILAPRKSQCSRIGISSRYSALIANMLEAYKFSPLASTQVQHGCEVFLSFSHSSSPAFLQLEGGGGNIEWSLLSGDIYSAPYKLFDGVEAFNARS